MQEFFSSFWMFAVVGGPILLALALIWGIYRSRRRRRGSVYSGESRESDLDRASRTRSSPD